MEREIRGSFLFFPLQLFALRWKIVIRPADSTGRNESEEKKLNISFICNAVKVWGRCCDLVPIITWNRRLVWISFSCVWGITLNFTLDRSRSKWNGQNFSSEKKGISLAETPFVMAFYCLIQTLGVLLWVTNNGVKEDMLIIKNSIRIRHQFIRGIFSFRPNANSWRFLLKKMKIIFILVQLWRLRFKPRIREEIELWWANR